MAHAAVVTELKGEKSSLDKALADSESSVLSFGKVFSGTFAAIAALDVFGKITDALGGWAEGYLGQERAESRLKSAIEATGGAAGFTLDQMKELADQMAATTLLEDDVVLGAMAVVSTFKNVRGDTFKDVIRLGTDMAEVLGTDAAGAMEQLGRALNDPERGMMMLQRAGVTLTDAQKDLIKSLIESGDVMGAQKVILDELESKYGGAAAAATETLGGRLEQLKKRIGEAGESIFESFVPAIEAIMPVVDAAVSGFENFGPVLGDAVEWIIDTGAAILDDLRPAIEWIGDQAVTRFTALQAVVEMMGEAASEVFALFGSSIADAGATAWEWFQKIEEATTELIVNGIIGLQVAIEKWRDIWTAAVLATALKTVEAWEDVKHLFSGVLPKTLEWFADNFTKIMTDVANFQAVVLENMGKNVAGFAVAVKDALLGKGWKFDPTDLMEGFQSAVDEFPDIAKRAKTDTEKALEQQLGDVTAGIADTFDEKRKAFDDRVAANKKSIKDAFQRDVKETKDIKDNASKEFDKLRNEEEKKEPKEKKQKVDREIKEKVDRKEKVEVSITGAAESAEQLYERIASSAGAAVKAGQEKAEDEMADQGDPDMLRRFGLDPNKPRDQQGKEPPKLAGGRRGGLQDLIDRNNGISPEDRAKADALAVFGQMGKKLDEVNKAKADALAVFGQMGKQPDQPPETKTIGGGRIAAEEPKHESPNRDEIERRKAQVAESFSRGQKRANEEAAATAARIRDVVDRNKRDPRAFPPIPGTRAPDETPQPGFESIAPVPRLEPVELPQPPAMNQPVLDDVEIVERLDRNNRTMAEIRDILRDSSGIHRDASEKLGQVARDLPKAGGLYD